MFWIKSTQVIRQDEYSVKSITSNGQYINPINAKKVTKIKFGLYIQKINPKFVGSVN